jgi:hypothetical protein
VNRIAAPPVLQGRIPNAVVAQLVEQLIRNQQVSGSNPLNGSRVAPHPHDIRDLGRSRAA